jgi:hypothetical protein
VDDPRALQILSTEHWSLLTARSLAYNEAFARAGMYLTFLSASLIVIGFLVATEVFADAVIPVTCILIAIDLFIGLATVGRMWNASDEEFRALKGMNRIRHAYSEMVPGIERYFVSSIHDDAKGVLANFGDPNDTSTLNDFLHGLTTAIGMIMAIDCVLIGALGAVVALGLGASMALALAAGVVAFLVGFGLTGYLAMRTAVAFANSKDGMFPRPD